MPNVRIADERDAEQVLGVYAPVVRDTVISFEEEPPSVDEIARRIGTTMEMYPWLVAESAGELMGYAYASSHSSRAAYRWSADVSVYIGAAHRGKGVGRALYTSLLQLLEIQGMYRVYAGIALPNPASKGLHESFGFTPVGVYREVGFKYGNWIDVGWWERMLPQPTPLPVRDPLSIGEVRSSAECSQALLAGTSLLNA